MKTEVDNQRLSDARLIHGAIMVVAWLFLSPREDSGEESITFDSWWFQRIERAVRGDR